MKVKIISSRIEKRPTLGGGEEKVVITRFQVGDSLPQSISIPFEEFSESVLMDRINEQAKHQAPLVGKEWELEEV